MIERYGQILCGFWCFLGRFVSPWAAFWVAHILARCHRPGAGLWAIWPFILRLFKPDLWQLSALMSRLWLALIFVVVSLDVIRFKNCEFGSFSFKFQTCSLGQTCVVHCFSKDPKTLIWWKAEPDISQRKVANSSKCLGGPWCCTRFGRHALAVEKNPKNRKFRKATKVPKKKHSIWLVQRSLMKSGIWEPNRI